MCKNVSLNLFFTNFTFASHKCVKHIVIFFVSIFSDCRFNFFWNGVIRNFWIDRLANFGLDFLEFVNNLLDFFMSKHYGIKHNAFRNFICSRFNHQNGFFSSADSQSQIAAFSLVLIWVDNKLSVNQSDLNRTCWSKKWNVRNRQSERRAKHCKWFWADIWVDRKRCCHHNNIVEKALWKERSQRSVYKTRNQNSLVTWTTFSLFKSARNFSNRIHFFLIFNRKRKEILPFLGLFAHGDIDHNNRVSTSDNA